MLIVSLPLWGTKYAEEIFTFSPGVKNQAMGNTGLTFSGSHAAGWWNPALLAKNSSKSIEVMRSEHFEGLLSQNQISLNLGKNSSININHLAIDKVKLTKLEDENDDVSNDNRPYVWKTVTNQDFIIYGGLARVLSDKISLGLSPKVAYRQLAQHSGYGFGADLGAYMDFGKGFAFGANLRDFFTTQILWESGEHELAMPNLDTEIGLNTTLLGERIPAFFALRTQAYFEERGDASSISSQAISADLHAGMMLQVLPSLTLMTGYDVDSFTAGMGLEYGDFGLDYSFKSSAPDGLGYSNKISLSYSW